MNSKAKYRFQQYWRYFLSLSFLWFHQFRWSYLELDLCFLGWSFLFTVLWNTMNHGSHKIFWLFRSKALQKAKKIKNPCRFRVSNLPSKFLKKSLSKMTVFISKMKWHFRIYFFQIFHFQTNFFFSSKNYFHIRNELLRFIVLMLLKN